jgi:hypothetical protein
VWHQVYAIHARRERRDSLAKKGSMQRNVSPTVRVKLHSLTNRKTDVLAREYEAFQTAVRATRYYSQTGGR